MDQIHQKPKTPIQKAECALKERSLTKILNPKMYRADPREIAQQLKSACSWSERVGCVMTDWPEGVKPLKSYLQDQLHGAVIRSVYLVFNAGMPDPAPVHDVLSDKEVIDAPTRVSFASFEPVSPPRVLHFLWMKRSKRIHVSVGDNSVQPIAFDPQKTAAIGIGFGMLQIDLIVGCIEITADHEAAAILSKRPTVSEKGGIEIQLILQPFITHLAVGKVNVEKEKIIQVYLDDAPFIIEALDTHAVFDASGFRARKSRHPAIALFCRRSGKIGFIAFDVTHPVGELIILDFGLLKGQHVGIQGLNGLEKILVHHRPIPVHIPGNQFNLSFGHGESPSLLMVGYGAKGRQGPAAQVIDCPIWCGCP
jgi:hypothetical protein